MGGGLAPCGLAPDPSGDVWVANCFASGGTDANVVRVDATTLDFEATHRVPEGDVPAGADYTFYRGLAYGGGSLWVAKPAERKPATVIQVDPQSGEQRAIRLPNPGAAPAWAETSGGLWVTNFEDGTLTRLDASTRAVETVNALSSKPAHRDGALWRIDPKTNKVKRIPLPYPPIGVAANEGDIWVTVRRTCHLGCRG